MTHLPSGWAAGERRSSAAAGGKMRRSDERRHHRPGSAHDLRERVIVGEHAEVGEVEARTDGASDERERAERPRRLPRASGDGVHGKLTGAIDGAEPVALERLAGPVELKQLERIALVEVPD